MNTKRQARRAPPLSTLVLAPPSGSTQLIRHPTPDNPIITNGQQDRTDTIEYHAPKKARLPLQLHEYKKASPQGATSFDFGPRPTFRINAVNPDNPITTPVPIPPFEPSCLPRKLASHCSSMNTKRQARRAPPLSTLVLAPPPGSTQLTLPPRH